MDRNKLEIVGTPYLIGIPERIRFHHHTKRIHQRLGAPIVSFEKIIGRFFLLDDQIKMQFIPPILYLYSHRDLGTNNPLWKYCPKKTLVKIKQQTIQAEKTFI